MRIEKLILVYMMFWLFIMGGCGKKDTVKSVFIPDDSNQEEPGQNDHSDRDSLYSGVQRSGIYEVSFVKGGKEEKLVVFQSSCPQYQAGYMDMQPKDQATFNLFKNRTISWVDFSFSGSISVKVKVIDPTKVVLSNEVRIFPSRHQINPTVNGDVIEFTIDKPGQYSVEIGENGYKNGLLIFANPMQTEFADTTTGAFKVFAQASKTDVNNLSASYSGIYFKRGVHHIGAYTIPQHIKKVYFEEGAWVYGALKLDGNPNVKIWGRGTLSAAKLNFREAHSIETLNGSDDFEMSGIVLADTKFYAVRNISNRNTISWVKVIGGWTNNTDGIRVGKNSTVSDCFIWANDDNIKVYRDNITFSNIVCWQLNEGGVIQLSWGGGQSENVTISGVDVLHAEYNNPTGNRGLVVCVGDRNKTGSVGYQKNFLIEKVITETPISKVFNIAPDPYSSNEIHGMEFKDWTVTMDVNTGVSNDIIGQDASLPFDGLVFDNVKMNGTKLNESNWMTMGNFRIENIVSPIFK